MAYRKFNNVEIAYHITENNSSNEVPRHCHNTYEFYLFLNGKADYTVGNEIFSLQPYDFLVIKPTVFHFSKIYSNVYNRLCINFSLSDVDDSLIPALENLQTYYNLKDSIFIKSIVKEILPLILESNDEIFLSASKQLANLILLQLSHTQPLKKSSRPIHPILSQIIDYIDGHLTDNLHISVIEKTFSVSSAWIYYIFKKQFNVSYMQYVYSKKLLLAQSLIRAGELPTKVALTCGFECYPTYFRRYKKLFGVSPQLDK